MRRNKKVLLGSIAALAVLAIGTGAVSTFAWYESTVSAQAAAGTSTTVLGTSKVDLASQNVTIDFTMTSSVSPELTDNDGKTYYVVGGAPYDASKKTEKANEQGVGTFAVTVEMSTHDKAVWVAAHSEDANDTDVDFTLTATLPVVLLKSDASATAGAKGAASANVWSKAHIVITIAKATGNLTVKTQETTKYGVRGDDSIESKSTLEASLAMSVALGWTDRA